MSMGMSMSPSMRLLQDVSQKMPSSGILAMNGLSVEEMEELAQEMVDLASNGHFSRRGDRPRRNLMDSDLFAQSAYRIADRGRDRNPEYAIASDLRIQSRAEDVRSRIEQSLSVLRRPERAPVQQIFSKRFMDEFDWVTKNRGKLVSHAVEHQKEFLADLYNPLLLKALNQRDLANVIGCHCTTVSRLIRNLLVEFPDTTVREFAVLVPGVQLTSLKGRYVIGLLARDSRYFEQGSGWKISDEDMARILLDDYQLDVKRRTVGNYRQWVDDHILRPRRNASNSVEPEEDTAEETPSDVDGR